MAGAELELAIESGPGQAGDLRWAALSVAYGGHGDQRRLEIRLVGLAAPGGIELGDLEMHCGPVASLPIEQCPDGRLLWRQVDLDMELEAGLSWQRSGDDWRVALSDSTWQLAARIPVADPLMAEVEISLSGLELEAMPSLLAESLGMSFLAGQLDGSIRFEQGQLSAGLALSGLGFDSEDGSLAADGMVLALDLTADPGGPERAFSLALSQSAGEALFGPLYLPPPEAPLRLELAGSWPDPHSLELDRLRLDDPGALALEGRARLVREGDGWQPAGLELERIELTLPLAWSRWLDGPVAGAGFSGIESSGRAVASLDWQRDGPFQAHAELDDLLFEDPSGRLGIDALAGTVAWTEQGPGLELAWRELAVYGLNFGSSRLKLDSGPEGVRLREPLRMPLLDGAVVLDRVRWRPLDPSEAGIEFDARIEPLSLGELTRQLDWPIFGGQLSGEFPGVRFADDQLRFTGGIEVQAFSGRIMVDNLAIERPFGTLPALTAEVEFSRLDLLELTGAFNIGRMEGQMSGWARSLRLLDWRPVAMDARVFTHEDARRRRISQRAVDNLSQLGGAGGALISGTVLRVFDDFPYRRAGLACRLSNNICHIDGVAPHESGGFYIVEGRSLPRLDIIGHRRLVDWPQLMGQIAAMMEGDS